MRKTARLGTISLALTLALYAWIGQCSPGYDDEMYNIVSISPTMTYGGLYAMANASDVHPPGQYLINKALWDATADWSVVRAITGACAAVSIWLVWWSVPWPVPLVAAFAWITICLNPASLLWCAGLRWYAYFVPGFNLLGVLIFVNPRSPIRFWGLFFGLALVLLWIGYAALVLVPAALLVALYSRRQTLRRDAMALGAFGLSALLLGSHQLLTFATVHARNSSSQTTDVLQALNGLALHVTGNQGAFPTSPFAISLIGGNMLLAFCTLHRFRRLRFDPYSALFVLGACALCVTTLSGKFRNLVTISTFQGATQAEIYGRLRGSILITCAIVLVTLGTVGEAYNVVTHTNTTKGSWNTPYRAALRDLEQKRQSLGCPALLVATHDVVLAYHASQSGAHVVLVGQYGWEGMIRAFTGCCALVQTFRGSNPKSVVEQYARVIHELWPPVATTALGADPYAPVKRRFDPDVPDYYIRISYFAPVRAAPD